MIRYCKYYNRSRTCTIGQELVYWPSTCWESQLVYFVFLNDKKGEL